jgi:hypothetical protein
MGSGQRYEAVRKISQRAGADQAVKRSCGIDSASGIFLAAQPQISFATCGLTAVRKSFVKSSDLSKFQA